MERTAVRSVTLVRHGPLVELQLAGGELIRVHQRRVAAMGLRVGIELTPAELTTMRRQAEIDCCEQRALRLLAVRERPAGELSERLRRWGLTEAESESVVARLERLGVVDDLGLAARTAERLKERGHGHRLVARDLARLSMPDALREETVRSHAVADLERARHVAEERFGPRPYAPDVQRRAAGLLARRGFDEETVMEAIGVERF